MRCKTLQLLVFWLIFILHLIEISYGHNYKTHYFDDYIEGIIILGSTSSDDSAVITQVTKKSFPNKGKYKLTVKTANKKLGIIATLQNFNLRSDILSGCTDKLQIWKKNRIGEVLIYSDCLEEKFPKPLIIVPPFEEHLTFELEVGNNNWSFSKLELTLTSFTSCQSESLAKSYEFFCKDERCVNEHFECDSRQNCADQSDEFDCPRHFNSNLFIVLSFFALFSICFYCCFCGFCRCRHEERESVTESSHNSTNYGSREVSPFKAFNFHNLIDSEDNTNDEEAPGDQCVICRDLIANSIISPCTHSACRSCLEKLILEKNECPFCRGHIDSFIDNKL